MSHVVIINGDLAYKRLCLLRSTLLISTASTLAFSPHSIMATAPTKQALLELYHNSLRTSRAFSSYNFREYFVRRTKDEFRDIQVGLSVRLFNVTF